MINATRAYNSWEHDWDFGTITKKSSTDRLRNEIRYYRELPYEWRTMFPHMIDASGWDATDHWITMEYYAYPNLGSYMMGSQDVSLDYDEWWNIMHRLRTFINYWAAHRYEYDNYGSYNREDARGNANAMYIIKTLREQQVFVEQDIAPALFVGDVININDQPTPTFAAIWPIVEKYIYEEIIPSYKPSFIHGDFCLSNMLYGRNGEREVIKFVDPRGSFGEIGNMGDSRYDVAKIYHSVDGGYAFFNNDKFVLERAKTSSDSWKWVYESGHDKLNALSAFEGCFFKGPSAFNKKEITVIEGLLYIGMCARHYENPDRQVALYLVGLQLLNKGMMMND